MGAGQSFELRQWPSGGLDSIFHPKSVAVVGVSNTPVQLGLMRPFLTCGFAGNIYPVHRDGGTILGLKVYRSIADIPGLVDYVVFGTPAASIPSLLEECAAKGVKAASFFTAGFGETGTEGGKSLERRILEIARYAGIRLIGPNCLGLYCPESHISFIPDSPLEPGSVGFISQSGGNSVYVIRAGASRGLTFSKVVSYGNAVDVDESELLEYLADDAATGVIGAYVEGVKDGERFRRALREAAAKKPVIVMKGGNTRSGARASASHTGALASQKHIWDSLLRESQAMGVESMEEMLDLLVAFRYMRPVRGTRAGIVGWGGGASVQAADECEAEGLDLPAFPPSLRNELARHWLPTGSILGNPVDTVSWSRDRAGFAKIIDAVAAWDGVDVLILHMGVIGGLMGLETMLELFPVVTGAYIEAAGKTSKPVAVVFHSNATPEVGAAFFEQARKCQQAAIPVYDSLGRTARAIVRYAGFCVSHPGWV
ncbi:MAG: CoA-binding protein [Chloroflexi bacterium]|nr:CoA-binding protein [Chloroflexota bacterium]